MAAQSITVGVDGTPPSDAALVYALDEALARGVAVVTVTVWWVGPVLAQDMKAAGDQARSAAALVQDQAIKRALGEVDGRPTITRRLMHGDAGVALVEAARDSSHLIVGCAHKRLLRRVVEGSVSAQCVRNSSVPVTVVPWPPHQGGDPVDLADHLVQATTTPDPSSEPARPASRPLTFSDA